jgi:sugar lactone lactonase YvrE
MRHDRFVSVRWSVSAVLAAAALAIGCGSSAGISAGAEGGHCYPNSTCNAGLTCASTLCVRLDAGAAGSGAAGSTGAAAGSNGSAGASTGGANGGSAGAAGSTGSAGVSGSAGASGTTGTDGGPIGDASTAGDAATSDGPVDATVTGTDGFSASDVALVPRASCPAGPFPTPAPGVPLAVCTDADSLAALRYDVTSGPVWVASENAFFFSCYSPTAAPGKATGDIVKYTPGGGCSIVFPDVGTNALTVAADGRLIGASFKTSSISQFDLSSGNVTVLVGAETGVKIGMALGLAVHSNGTIFFTNVSEAAGTLATALYRIDPSSGVAQSVLPGHTFAPGTGAMALSADETLLIAFGLGRFTLIASAQFDSGEADSAIGGQNGGVALDCADNIYIPTHTAGKILSFSESNLGSFPTGRDLAFGGADSKSVLLVDQKTISIVPMNVPGVP